MLTEQEHPFSLHYSPHHYQAQRLTINPSMFHPLNTTFPPLIPCCKRLNLSRTTALVPAKRKHESQGGRVPTNQPPLPSKQSYNLNAPLSNPTTVTILTDDSDFSRDKYIKPKYKYFQNSIIPLCRVPGSQNRVFTSCWHDGSPPSRRYRESSTGAHLPPKQSRYFAQPPPTRALEKITPNPFSTSSPSPL